MVNEYHIAVVSDYSPYLLFPRQKTSIEAQDGICWPRHDGLYQACNMSSFLHSPEDLQEALGVGFGKPMTRVAEGSTDVQVMSETKAELVIVNAYVRSSIRNSHSSLEISSAMLTLADILASHKAGLSGNILPDRVAVTSPPRLYSPSTELECKGRVSELAVRREWEDIASYFGCTDVKTAARDI